MRWRDRHTISGMMLLCVLLVCLLPLPSHGLTVGSSGRINFRNETVAVGSSGIVNCAGDGIECEIVGGILNINVGGGAETSLEDPGGNGLINRTGAGVTEPYAGTTCTNQVLRVLSAAGAGTCVTVTSAYVDSSIALTGGHLGQFAATTSAQLASVLSDEDGGSGGFVRAGGTVALATALAANGANCSAGQFPLGVDASGAVETCTALPTTIAGTANQITASAATGAVVLSIPTSPTLPGTTTGTFSGDLTGTASLATALVANGANCAAGSAPLGVDASGAVESCFAVQPAVTWGNGLSIAGATANVTSTEANFLTDGATTDLICGAAAQGKMQVMDSGALQYCGGETTALLWKGLLTQSGLTWNATAGTCTGDANGGKLTVNGSAQIVCASDQGGGGGGGANTFAAADFNLTGDDVSLDYVNAQLATGSNNGFLSSVDFMLFSAKQEAVSWGAGLNFDAGVATVASQESGFLADGGATDLTCGGGALGQAQVMNSGALQYCDGADDAVLRAGFLLPSPLTFNVTTATCTGDANGGKLTVNGSNQVVCATDSVGEGGGGPGDMTAVGNLASGDAGTAGFPLTNVWWLESTAPSSPASTQGITYLDSTSKNFAIKTSDGAVKHLVQTVIPAASQFVTAIADDGAVSQARPSSADLIDGSALARLAGPQTITATQVVPRDGGLSASSGSLTPNADLYDVVYRHDVAGTVAMQTPTVTGNNPRNMQPLTISFYAASAQAVTWSTAYAGGYGIALPDTIPAGKYTALAFRYNSTSAKWELWSAHDPTIYVNSVLFQGTTDGVVTIQPQASAGTYNFNLPTTAGASGEVLTSAGGVGAAMTWTALATGATATSTTVGQVLRVGSGPTIAYGALDLADPDAVTGILPNANTTAASANTASAIVTRDGSGNFTAGTITAALTGTAALATALAADLPFSGLTPATAASKLLGRGSAGGGGDYEEITLGAGLTMTGTTLSAAGGGTGTVQLPALAVKLPSANPAIPDSSAATNRLLFDAATDECIVWEFTMPADYAGTPVIKVPYSMLSATAGTVKLYLSLWAHTPGDAADIDTEDYDTPIDCLDAAVPGTAGRVDVFSCPMTNNDSAAANDLMHLKVCRDANDAVNDTATGDMEVRLPVLQYAR